MSTSNSSDEEFESADEGEVEDVNVEMSYSESTMKLSTETSSHDDLAKFDINAATNLQSCSVIPSISMEVNDMDGNLKEENEIAIADGKNEAPDVSSDSTVQEIAQEVGEIKVTEDVNNQEESGKHLPDIEKEIPEVPIETGFAGPKSDISSQQVVQNTEGDNHLDKSDEVEAVPAEIALKISTRSVSSRAKQKSKPSLGAKKLGGVRISQPSDTLGMQSDDVGSTKNLIGRESTSHSSNDTKSREPDPLSSSDWESAAGGDGGGWGGWFVPPKSLLSSVSSFTNQIMATVETGLNIPDPEELAKEEASVVVAKRENTEEESKPAAMGFSQLMGGVSNITRFMESTSNKVLSTGLDTLELLGKKTITVLQQTDPGLKKTKAALANPLNSSSDLPCLSQILREAKEKNENDPIDASAATKSDRKSTTLFEDHHGLVHLEALEMLSQQCENRISSQIRRLAVQRRAVVEEIASLCVLEDEHFDENVDADEFDIENIEQCLTSSLDKIDLRMPLRRLIDAIREGFEYSASTDDSADLTIAKPLNTLALVASLTLEMIHKAAELIMMTEKKTHQLDIGKLEADAFRSIVSLLGQEILRLGNHFANQIVRCDQSRGKSSQYSTEIYFEASNYNSYIRNALKLMTPILQARVI